MPWSLQPRGTNKQTGESRIGYPCWTRTTDAIPQVMRRILEQYRDTKYKTRRYDLICSSGLTFPSAILEEEQTTELDMQA